MAQRRMFSKKITDTDKFLEMPLSSQALYFHLNMGADDDGFIDRPKTIQKTIGASDDDMKLLTVKQFIIPFESGIVVIKDWRIHNYIRKDTYQPTIYQEEKRLVENTMTELPEKTSTSRPRKVDAGKGRIGKDRIDKDNLYNADDKEKIPFQIIIDYLNLKAGTKYRASSAKTKHFIKSRWNEGFREEDFKQVIDIKVRQWLYDLKMNKFLRPETLFGTKFESYLNERSIKQAQPIDDDIGI
ncbi:conserved phage C-terminal domain-containing protein [Streptococcus anginosus]|uniref:DNA replication protein n=2 Tax=Streptococcus anginosus TaxID=1328 RepID=A0A413KNA1_STRAP|nr:conserved phage C-terminal domain-containing protein [Streptococcus anginosus]MCW1031245.1 conserved phage C-terminal domain-containing protein [Streptococcus anginosus]MCW1067677.1 conserved phage C-terminal domain-containing protein [Streptococcus anginosus]MCW1077848.1 conserved phage C-terminal domain-containing protein [Streptococcus anginosus]RGT61671.1 DNA replication protein [Streptococcus anginosus]RGY87013.1 DNA replication protein [Streptococcus anginosus]